MLGGFHCCLQPSLLGDCFEAVCLGQTHKQLEVVNSELLMADEAQLVLLCSHNLGLQGLFGLRDEIETRTIKLRQQLSRAEVSVGEI